MIKRKQRANEGEHTTETYFSFNRNTYFKRNFNVRALWLFTFFTPQKRCRDIQLRMQVNVYLPPHWSDKEEGGRMGRIGNVSRFL